MTPTPDPPASRTERLFARIAVLQTALTVIALGVSALAMYAALVEANSSRRQTKAAVWPHLDAGYGVFDGADGDADGVFFVANRGIGPARIRTASVTVDGEPATGWRDALNRLYEGETRPAWSYITLTPRVVDPGDLVSVLTISNADDARRLRSSGKSERLAVEICYCSVFDECWLQHHPDRGDPDPVKACPDYGGAAFQN